MSKKNFLSDQLRQLVVAYDRRRDAHEQKHDEAFKISDTQAKAEGFTHDDSGYYDIADRIYREIYPDYDNADNLLTEMRNQIVFGFLNEMKSKHYLLRRFGLANETQEDVNQLIADLETAAKEDLMIRFDILKLARSAAL